MASSPRKIAALILSVFITGCASVINGHREMLRVNSVPDGATIVIAEGRTGKRIFQGHTPAVVSLRRTVGYFKPALYRVTISKDGFSDRVVDLQPRISGWYIVGNVVIGGAIGWLIVDPVTGGMWKLKPDEIAIDFEEKHVAKDGDLQIVTIDQIPDAVRASLIPLGVVAN